MLQIINKLLREKELSLCRYHKNQVQTLGDGPSLMCVCIFLLG